MKKKGTTFHKTTLQYGRLWQDVIANRILFFCVHMGKKGGWWALSHEYKVCKCPHIHKKLQPKKISIPIALFTARQNVEKKQGCHFPVSRSGHP